MCRHRAKAYEFYLRANHLQRERTVENIVMARDLYRECVEEDPNYAAAWARLGRCYRFLEKFGEEGPENLELAQWAFHRAFALNPDLAIAHNLYTQIEADLGNAQAAMVRLLERAQTHPNDPELFAGLVQACRFCGLLDESIAAHHRARRLDSRAVTSVAHTFFLKGDYERALESYGAAAGYYLDAAILTLTGQRGEAAELLARRHSSGVRAGWMRTLMDSLRALLEGEQAKSAQLAAEHWRSRQGIRKPSSIWRGIWPEAERTGGVEDHPRSHRGRVLLLDRLAARSLVAATLPPARVRSRFDVLHSARGGSKSGVPCRRRNTGVVLTVDR